MKQSPVASVIIPCLNEKEFISKCLDSVIRQTYPSDKTEILVIDGGSKDGTQEIVNEFQKCYPTIKLLHNPGKITPTALNIGIQASKGEYVIRMDAHSLYNENYILNCIRYLNEYGADNVGGVLTSSMIHNSLIAKAIITVISSRFGVGNSYFRIGCAVPKWVDTVPFGCYRKSVFETLGGFNEKLVRGQDLEFNLRLKKKGGKILLHPDISGTYYAPSSLCQFIKHYFENGLWVTLTFKYSDIVPVAMKHLIPMFFTCILILSAIISCFHPFGAIVILLLSILYLFLNVGFSIYEAVRRNEIHLIFILPILYPVLHLSYGLGSLLGVTKSLGSRKFWTNLLKVLA